MLMRFERITRGKEREFGLCCFSYPTGYGIVILFWKWIIGITRPKVQGEIDV